MASHALRSLIPRILGHFRKPQGESDAVDGSAVAAALIACAGYEAETCATKAS